MTHDFRNSPPQPALPDGMAVERFAVAMGAASGVNMMSCDEGTAAFLRRCAQAALLVFGSDAPGLGEQLGAARLAEVMDEARACLRYAAAQIEGPDGSEGDEPWVKRIYKAAAAMEVGAAVLTEPAEEFV